MGSVVHQSRLIPEVKVSLIITFLALLSRRSNHLLRASDIHPSINWGLINPTWCMRYVLIAVCVVLTVNSADG